MFAWITNHLWQSTLFAGGVALLVPLVRRNGAHVRYWLWWAASVKFLVPFSLLAMLGRELAGGAPSIYVSSDVAAAAAMIGSPVALPLSAALALAALGAWACGFVTVLAVRARRAWQLRAVLAAADPGIQALRSQGPEVRYSSASVEPGIVGIFRPVLLLPRGIAERLTREQLGAVVEHELCHWRRQDNLLAAVHMVVEAVFWFHPLVWWIGARLIDERERACDEAVLRAGHERRAYAEGILEVCELYVATRLACAAGVSGADLSLRIASILRNTPMNELNLAQRAVLGTAALAALLVPIAIGVVTTGVASAQDREDLLPLVRIAPEYPPEAVERGLEGYVDLEFTITRDGTTRDIVVVESSSPLFEEPAVAALSKWRYQPPTSGGEPAERTRVRTVIRFMLSREAAPPAPPAPAAPPAEAPRAAPAAPPARPVEEE